MRKYFFLSSLSFLILIVIIIYQDTYPEWKSFQKKFKYLALVKIKKDYKTAMEKFKEPQMQFQYQLLKNNYKNALKTFNGHEVQSKIKQWMKESKNITRELEYARAKFQKERIELQKLEQKFIFANEVKKKKLKEEISIKKIEIQILEQKVRDINKNYVEFEEKLRLYREPLEKTKIEMEQFYNFLDDLKRKINIFKRQKIEIKQIVNEELRIVDRCQSCHLGVQDKNFEDAPIPYTYHLSLLESHPVEKFGCVVCHNGQGRATIKKDAHEESEDWLFPILSKDTIESSCAKCHTGQKVPEALRLTAGRKLFLEAGCLGCHQHQDYRKVSKIGPDLNYIGNKVKFSWLKKWLKNPKEYLPKTRMPNFLLLDKEIESISALLMTFVNKKIPSTEISGAYEIGEKIFKESHCVSCHLVNGRGGKIAPDLGKIASKMNRGYFVQYIKEPKKFQSETKMPRYRFSNEEVNGLAEYMFTEFQDFDAPPELEIKPALSDMNKIKEGERLVRHYGCFGCHNIPGIEGPLVGAELTDIGLKRKSQLDFGLLRVSKHEKNLENWLILKLKEPRIFRDSLKMPQYNFSDEELKSLVTVLIGFITEKVPGKFYYKKDMKQTEFIPQGEVGQLIRDLNCLVCHTIHGQGGEIAPDISYEGSQVQQEWLLKFFQNPDTIRLNLVERMPKFKFSEREAKILSQYFQMVLINDEISHLQLAQGNKFQGRKLFFNYGCNACHQVGDKGGSIGPELSYVGKRLKNAWIFSWLKNPQKYRANTVCPDLSLNNEETSSITEFLYSLK